MSEQFNLPNKPKHLKIAETLTEFLRAYQFAETEDMKVLREQIVQNLKEGRPFIEEYTDYEIKGRELVDLNTQNPVWFVQSQILLGVLKAALFAQAGDMHRMKDHFYASLEYAEFLAPELYQELINVRTAANS